MICIGKTKTVINDDLLQKLMHQFEEKHVFICDQLLDTSLQPLIGKLISQSNYQENIHFNEKKKVIAKEYSIFSEAKVARILHMYLNQPTVIEAVKKISGSKEIKGFVGRIYKFESKDDCFDNWHDDIGEDERLLGVSVNLSEKMFKGGIFKLRNKKSKKVHASVKHEEWGAAHFFKISPDLHHKVEKVKGNNPRVAFAGWFKKESYSSLIVKHRMPHQP